jgi:sugar phosphate isomerase/epimerase
MFDTHNAADEIEPHPVVLDRYFEYVRHVHVNEMDGKHPGTGDYDFSAIFEVLEHRGYQHWISLEAFDFTPGADTIARESIAHIREQMGEAGA